MDIYKTKDLLSALEYVHVPGDFLLTTLVTGTENHDTDIIEIDIERNGKKMAPFVSPMREGVVVTREGFQTKTHKIPYIKLKTKHTAQEALRRRAGSTVYQGATPAQFISKEVGKDLKKLDNMIFRREEWMLAQGIQTGIVPVIGEGVSYAIDFDMKATHKPVLTSTDVWDNAAADIQGDLDTWATLVYDDSGMTATGAILGSAAARAMLNSNEFNASLDRRRIDRGEIKPERLPKGVKYYGFDRESGLDLWGYSEKFYDDASGTMMPLIDPKNVIVFAAGARVERHYGMIQNVETDFIGPRWPDNWVEKDPSVHWLSLESAPLVAPHQIDCFLCAKVLA